MSIVIGITGGIATGKTTVARMFEEFGAEHIDADVIARETLAPGSSAVAEVVEKFGSIVSDGKGGVDRAKLADIIFNDPKARETLNGITHPRIIRVLEERISEFRKMAGEADALVVEIPLLVEAGLMGMVDKIALVTAEQDTQINRLQMRSALTSEQAQARVRAQTPAGQKVDYADWIISTETSMEETRAQVQSVWRELRGGDSR